jgi:hypothetical protein
MPQFIHDRRASARPYISLLSAVARLSGTLALLAAASPAGAQDPAPGADAPKPSAPGAVVVDEQAAERALERTLVAGGALLLPAGQAEIEPSFTYTRRESDVSPVLVDTGDGDLALTNPNLERDELTPALGVRVGLPLDSQIELSLPYNFVQQDEVIDTGGGRITRDGWGNGIGDLRVGLAKTVFREGVVRPDLIARVSYNTGIGERDDNDIALDGGFSAVTGQLVALKRQDPLAFVASGFYQKTFEDNDLNPGDQYGFSLGTFLAASPATSLRFQLQTTFIDDVERDGRTISDSDRNEAVLVVGASSILGRGVLLDVAGGIGLTDEAPDYFISISLPIRFDLPVL